MLVNLDYVLKKARQGNYAVGLFNTTDTDMLEAAISAAEELNSPIIIGTAEILLPSGELDLIAPSIIEAAKRAKVPVVVHYDHGLTFERCMQALKLGFSSIMFDGSAGDAEQNMKDTANIVKIAHAFGATVEGEIGHVGEAAAGDNTVSDSYTTPEEAIEFIENVTFDSKESRLDDLKQDMGDNAYLFDGYDENNPLRDWYKVTLTDLTLSGETADTLTKIPGIVKSIRNQDTIDKLVSMTSYMDRISLWVMIALALISVFIISNTIKALVSIMLPLKRCF